MRRPPFAYPRAEMQARVIERLEAGAPMRVLERQPGFPSRQTLYRWGVADPDFARRLDRARAWGRGLRTSAAAGPVFDAPRAEALLLAVRRGAAVRDLVRRPEGPNRELLNRWKRERPDFAAELVEAARLAKRVRDWEPKWPYDEGLADRLVLRAMRGETLPQLMADPAMPGKAALTRWRRRHPEFAGALRMAATIGQRRRVTERRRRPELLDAILDHVLHGGSLRTAADIVPGAPHRVTLCGWVKTDPVFAKHLQLAKQMRDQMIMDLALDIARSATRDSVAVDAARFAALRQRLGQLNGGRKPAS
jgi:hypothetical protein